MTGKELYDRWCAHLAADALEEPDAQAAWDRLAEDLEQERRERDAAREKAAVVTRRAFGRPRA